MKLRNTILAFLVLGGLVAWIYFYEYRGEEAREKAETAGKKVLDFDATEADGLDLVRPDGTIMVRKENGDWRLTAPLAARADADEVSGLLSALSWLEIDKKIETPGADLDPYKLKDPPLKIVVHPGEGKPDLELSVGDRTPIGSSYYARKGGDSGIVTVASSVDRLLQATADKLRYKKVVGVDSWKVARFSVARGGSVASFAKDGEEWKVESPSSFPADRAKVSSLLYDLTGITAEGFEPEGATPQSAGLDPPEATLQIQDKDGKSVAVRFSAKDAAGLLRAKRADMPEIFRVKGDLLDKLAVNAADYRDARVAPVDRWQVSEIRATMSGGEKVVVKDAESNWRWGDKEGPTVDAKGVDDLLEALDAAKAVSWIEGPDAARNGIGGAAALTLSVRAGEGKPVEVRMGAEDSGKVRFASSASSSVYEVEKGTADRLAAAVAALRAPAPQAAASADGVPKDTAAGGASGPSGPSSPDGGSH